MRNAYRGFYPPTEQELDEIWRDGFFTFDANVLLNLYRLPSSKDYLSILAELKDRIWLSHQAGLEYHENRLIVVHEMRAIYSDIMDEMTKALDTWKKKYTRHPSLDLTRIWQIMGTAIDETRTLVRQAEDTHPKLERDDPIRDRLAELFANNVGPPFSEAELPGLYKEVEQRYAQKIPPGYKDEKPIPQKYGDFLLWRQVCNEAHGREKPVILVTDERKEDWWLRYKGKTIGPRTELVAEMWDRAGVHLHMYSSDHFLQFAGKHLKKGGQLRQVAQEAKSLREAEEELRRQLFRESKKTWKRMWEKRDRQRRLEGQRISPPANARSTTRREQLELSALDTEVRIEMLRARLEMLSAEQSAAMGRMAALEKLKSNPEKTEHETLRTLLELPDIELHVQKLRAEMSQTLRSLERAQEEMRVIQDELFGR